MDDYCDGGFIDFDVFQQIVINKYETTEDFFDDDISLDEIADD